MGTFLIQPFYLLTSIVGAFYKSLFFFHDVTLLYDDDRM